MLVCACICVSLWLCLTCLPPNTCVRNNDRVVQQQRRGHFSDLRLHKVYEPIHYYIGTARGSSTTRLRELSFICTRELVFRLRIPIASCVNQYSVGTFCVPYFKACFTCVQKFADEFWYDVVRLIVYLTTNFRCGNKFAYLFAYNHTYTPNSSSNEALENNLFIIRSSTTKVRRDVKHRNAIIIVHRIRGTLRKYYLIWHENDSLGHSNRSRIEKSVVQKSNDSLHRNCSIWFFANERNKNVHPMKHGNKRLSRLGILPLIDSLHFAMRRRLQFSPHSLTPSLCLYCHYMFSVQHNSPTNWNWSNGRVNGHFQHWFHNTSRLRRRFFPRPCVCGLCISFTVLTQNEGNASFFLWIHSIVAFEWLDAMLAAFTVRHMQSFYISLLRQANKMHKLMISFRKLVAIPKFRFRILCMWLDAARKWMAIYSYSGN